MNSHNLYQFQQQRRRGTGVADREPSRNCLRPGSGLVTYPASAAPIQYLGVSYAEESYVSACVEDALRVGALGVAIKVLRACRETIRPETYAWLHAECVAWAQLQTFPQEAMVR